MSKKQRAKRRKLQVVLGDKGEQRFLMGGTWVGWALEVWGLLWLWGMWWAEEGRILPPMAVPRTS